MRYYAIVILLLSCVFTSGCRKCQSVHSYVDDNLKSWIPYSVNQQVIFANDSLQTDTLTVVALVDETLSEVSDKCPSVFDQRRITMKFSSSSEPYLVFTMKQNSLIFDYGATQAKFVAMSASDWFVMTPSSDAHYSPNDVVNDSVYNDVLYIASQQTPLKIFRVAKNHGFLHYVDTNNVIWNLQ